MFVYDVEYECNRNAYLCSHLHLHEILFDLGHTFVCNNDWLLHLSYVEMLISVVVRILYRIMHIPFEMIPQDLYERLAAPQQFIHL